MIILLLIFAFSYYIYKKRVSKKNYNENHTPSHAINSKKQVDTISDKSPSLDANILYKKLVATLNSEGFITSEKLIDDDESIYFRVKYEGANYVVILNKNFPELVKIVWAHFIKRSEITASDDDICRATTESNSKNKCAKIINTTHNDEKTLSSSISFLLLNDSIDSRIISWYFDECKSAITHHAKSI